MVNDPHSLVDFHCHLDLYPDFEGIVAECEERKIYTLAVTTTPLAFERNLAVTRTTNFVRAALGLHPQLVAERAHEIDVFTKWLNKSRYVGEVGLDASPRHYRSFSEQQRIFSTILEQCAAAGGKVLTVHSVRAATKVLDCLERYFPPDRGRVVLHWFTGSASEAKRAVELGCYFSINSQMLIKAAHRATVAGVIPLERLLTETDGPFVELNSRPVRPSDVENVVEELASVLRRDAASIRSQVRTNLKMLLV